jgi:uncharacterized protein YodC (DUF2158 family)
MSRFVIGDTVQLKSGGPMMTVAEIGPTEVWCVWFEGKSKRGDNFPPEVLRAAKPASGAIRVVPLRFSKGF